MNKKEQKLIQSFVSSRDFALALIQSKREENNAWQIYAEICRDGSWRVINRSTHAAWGYFEPDTLLIRSVGTLSDEEWEELIKICGEDASDEALAKELFLWEECLQEKRETFLQAPNIETAPNMHGIDQFRQKKHGGARRGAGPKVKPVVIDADPQTPLMWLWQELTRRFGTDVAEEIHLAFNVESQEYQKAQIAKQRARRKQVDDSGPQISQ